MSRLLKIFISIFWISLIFACSLFAQKGNNGILEIEDVFEFEYVTEPHLSPDQKKIVYVRNYMDKMTDFRRSNIWIIQSDGSDHHPITTGGNNNFSPRWSPSGNRIIYASTKDGLGIELFMRWVGAGQTARISNLPYTPNGITWSPNGKWIAFTMFVPHSSPPMVSLPGKPAGAEWAEAPKEIDDLMYRLDGNGFLGEGYTHLFVIPAEGGSSRQLTFGPYNHQGAPKWTPDGKSLIISGNRNKGWESNLNNSEIYAVDVETGSIKALTERPGPDMSPTVSPNGEYIAYLGYDEQNIGYQVNRLYLMSTDGSDKQVLIDGFDRNITNPKWNKSGQKIFFQYEDRGVTKVAATDLSGNITEIASGLGGNIGLPYGGGSYDLSGNDIVTYAFSNPEVVSEVAVSKDGTTKIITDLNSDLLAHKELGDVEEIWFKSNYDGRDIQGWVITPPNFNKSIEYPLILNIHGGPHLNYGSRFTVELQLMAAAGYVVLYVNPRGSTSYGEEFGQLIQNKFPSYDYNDLMSGVDELVKRSYVNKDSLYITGGSGGGLLTAWAISKTDRFNAAVVEKPVINWYSFALTSDFIPFYHKHWFPGYPWENQNHYMMRSPISRVGTVNTPAMIMAGDADHRVPISQAEQYYSALRLKGVETVMVRIPGASHYVSARPSQMMAKVAYTLKWFERY